MRIDIVINDDTIRANVADAVQFAEWDNFLSFPDDNARDEFISDVTDDIISKYEIYADYTPNYPEIVLDAAERDGYAL
jgi:hypothetical protein